VGGTKKGGDTKEPETKRKGGGGVYHRKNREVKNGGNTRKGRLEPGIGGRRREKHTQKKSLQKLTRGQTGARRGKNKGRDVGLNRGAKGLRPEKAKTWSTLDYGKSVGKTPEAAKSPAMSARNKRTRKKMQDVALNNGAQDSWTLAHENQKCGKTTITGNGVNGFEGRAGKPARRASEIVRSRMTGRGGSLQ